MEKVVEAVYENGVLTPLEPLDLPEHLRVRITIQVPTQETPEAVLEGWRTVYDGLSEADISEIERIALDRSHFMRQGT